MKRWLIGLFLSILLVMVLLIGASGWLTSLALKRFRTAVYELTGGVYTITWEQLTIEPYALRVRLKGLRLQPDTTLAWKAQLPLALDAEVPELWLRAIDLRQLWNGEVLSMRRIWLNKARLGVLINLEGKPSARLLELPGLHLEHLEVDQLELQVWNRHNTDTLLNSKELSFHLHGIRYDTLSGLILGKGDLALRKTHLLLNQYPFTLDSLEVTISNNQLELHTHRFRPDELIRALSSGKQALLKEGSLVMELQDLEIRSRDIGELLQALSQFPEGTSRIDAVTLHQPVFRVDKVSSGMAAVAGGSPVFRELDHSPLTLSRFQVRDASIVYQKEGKVERINLDCKNLRLLPGSRFFPFQFDSLKAGCGKLQWELNGGNYGLAIDTFSLLADSMYGNATLSGLTVLPEAKLRRRLQKEPYLKGVFQVLIQQLAIKGWNLPQTLQGLHLEIDKLSLLNPELKIQRDRNKPFAPTRKPMLQEMLSAFPLPYQVRQLELKGGSILSSELPPGKSEWVKVVLDRVALTANGLSNIRGKDWLKADFKARIAGSGLLNAHFEGAITDKNCRHTLAGRLSGLELAGLNAYLEPAFLVRIHGRLNQADFQLRASRYQESGTLRLNYTDLSVELLDVKGGSRTPNPLKQLAASRFFRPDFISTMAERVFWKRDASRGFVNFWLRGLLEAAKNTIAGQTAVGRMATGKNKNLNQAIQKIKQLEEQSEEIKRKIDSTRNQFR